MRLARELPRSVVHRRRVGGALNDVVPDATAFAHRNAKVFAAPPFHPPSRTGRMARRPGRPAAPQPAPGRRPAPGGDA